MNRIFLGKPEHWLILAAFAGVGWAMGSRHLHVRDFVPFALVTLGMVTAALAFIVWRYRSGERVTREPFEDAVLPHGGREEEEV